MKAIPTDIAGCFIIEREVFEDNRGRFTELYNKTRLEEALGTRFDFVQDNVSTSGLHVLRGLHFQKGAHAQAKYLSVLKGAIQDVVVDIRKESATYGMHLCFKLSATNNRSLFIPKGMAHGFLCLEEGTILAYKCDAYYHAPSEGGIHFSDPQLNIPWGIKPEQAILSERDCRWPNFNDLKV